MNFYKHYIGDFQRDTGHLSLTERGAYLCLMHHYYATEKPLPNDHTALCRVAGAITKPERDAVRVAMGFFEPVESGLMHARIEAEIHKAEQELRRIDELRSGESYRRFREVVLARDGEVCKYCGATGVPLQLDHVVPRSRGGADEAENLAPACKPCNSSKGARTPEEWRCHK